MNRWYNKFWNFALVKLRDVFINKVRAWIKYGIPLLLSARWLIDIARSSQHLHYSVIVIGSERHSEANSSDIYYAISKTTEYLPCWPKMNCNYFRFYFTFLVAGVCSRPFGIVTWLTRREAELDVHIIRH